MVDVTGCIVLYKNDRKILSETIESFLSTDLNVLLYLIDNSPTQCLCDINEDRRIQYIHNPSNPGFGAGHNIGIRKAMEAGSKYHLALNPDIYYKEPVLRVLKEYMDEHADIGNLMPKINNLDGTTQYLCKLLPTPYDWIGRRFNPFKSMVERRNHFFELKFTNYDKIMEVPYLSGCFMFLRISALKKAGFFDEKIFMYGEEVDLCRRINKAGYRTVFYPYVSVVHHFQKGSHKSFRLTWVGIESAMYYFNKWGWIFDRDRKRINQQILKRLGFNNK